MKPIRLSICPDVRRSCYSDDPDPFLGGYHKGWRLPDSETVAFFHGGSWWACPNRDCPPIKCSSKTEALNTL